MARQLGYGGLANTNGARDFSGKVEAEIVPVTYRHMMRNSRGVTYQKSPFNYIRLAYNFIVPVVSAEGGPHAS